MATPIAIVGYLALFAGVAVAFLFANLLVGRFVRPKLPNAEKLEVYECGEPTIGSSFVQFDLRFYVVALLFIIFDVEVAFFFPWATVFGKATQLAAPNFPVQAAEANPGEPPTADGVAVGGLSPQVVQRMSELGFSGDAVQAFADAQVATGTTTPAGEPAPVTTADRRAAVQTLGRRIAATSLADIGVFFAVLMVGFAYVWRRGDLDWVRATTSVRDVVQRPPPSGPPPGTTKSSESILSA